MGNLGDLHADFLLKFPDMKISLSAFRAFRPPQCILAGPKSTHNIYVCKIHGNIRLKFHGLKQEFIRKKFDYNTSYRDYFASIICSNFTSDCYFGDCKNCPDIQTIFDELKATLQRLSIEKITYNQWLTTDRYYVIICNIKYLTLFCSLQFFNNLYLLSSCQLVSQIESVDIFLKNLAIYPLL